MSSYVFNGPAIWCSVLHVEHRSAWCARGDLVQQSPVGQTGLEVLLCDPYGVYAAGIGLAVGCAGGYSEGAGAVLGQWRAYRSRLQAFAPDSVAQPPEGALLAHAPVGAPEGWLRVAVGVRLEPWRVRRSRLLLALECQLA